MQKLIYLASTATSDKERQDLEALINQLTYLRYRDLATFLRLLWAYCSFHKRYDVCRELVREDIVSD